MFEFSVHMMPGQWLHKKVSFKIRWEGNFSGAQSWLHGWGELLSAGVCGVAVVAKDQIYNMSELHQILV